METLGIRATEISERAKVSKATVSFWLAGTNGAKGKNLLALAEVLQCSPSWLETGKEGEARDEAEADANGSPSKKDYALIPQYTAKGSTGDGYHNDHVEVTEGMVFKRGWLKRMALREENLCVIYADGSSMEPYIFDGDVLLIDLSDTQPRNGKVYAIKRPDDSVSIKRLVQQMAGDWLIRSDNQDKTRYPDELVSPESLQQIEILGRAVWGGGGM